MITLSLSLFSLLSPFDYLFSICMSSMLLNTPSSPSLSLSPSISLSISLFFPSFPFLSLTQSLNMPQDDPIAGTRVSVPKFIRSQRAQSVPSIDGRTNYTNCFRLSDLIIGDVIGHGFYGNVIKVTHRYTGQVMVMKEVKDCTDDAKKTFRKEVSH